MAKNRSQDKRPADLRPIDRSTLTWEADDAAGSIERIAEAVTAEAEDAIDWYLEKKRSQMLGAR